MKRTPERTQNRETDRCGKPHPRADWLKCIMLKGHADTCVFDAQEALRGGMVPVCHGYDANDDPVVVITTPTRTNFDKS